MGLYGKYLLPKITDFICRAKPIVYQRNKNVPQALSEMRRVLRPEGELIFCEHGLASDENVRRLQNRINPIWKRIGGGCNLNRQIPNLIEQGGFKINNIETMYIPGWKPVSFNYWGAAVQR